MSLREQTQRHVDHLAGGTPGDCWATALACLLEVPREEVPHFVADYPEEGHDWWYASVAWVEENSPGNTLSVVSVPNPLERVIATGPSPRGPFAHCVLVDAQSGEMVWDVHPDRTGILSMAEYVGVVPKR